jgi:chromate transport protein ChrA
MQFSISLRKDFMIKKQHRMKHIIMVLGAFALMPSIANAHGITNQSVAEAFVLADIVAMIFGVFCYLLCKRLGITWSITFSIFNIVVAVVGITASIKARIVMSDPFINNCASFSIATKLSVYLALAVSLHLIIVLLIAGWRYFNKPRPPRERWPYGD